MLTLFNIWFERRVVARMQHRIGPNVHGPFGLLQSLADGMKLMLKEDIIPKARRQGRLLPRAGDRGDPGVPGLRGDPVRADGDDPVQPTPTRRCSSPTCRSAVLYILAVASVGIYGIVLGRLVLRLDLLAARRSALAAPR